MTTDRDGRVMAWGVVEAAGQLALLGVRVDSGKTVRVDLLPLGRSHVQLARMTDGNLCLFTGQPGRFMKYDVSSGKLAPLGPRIAGCTYWLGMAVGPDHWFYMGAFPGAKLVACDLDSGQVHDFGAMTDDPREKYLLHPVVSPENVVYCPVGLHHPELWSFDPKTRAKRQLLPKEQMERQGQPDVWLGVDGRVYGRVGQFEFVCGRDSLQPAKAGPRRYDPTPRIAAGELVGPIDEKGRLVLEDMKTRRKRYQPTDFRGAAAEIFSVGCQHEGKIYGGTFSPAHTFSFNPATSALLDLGPITGGQTQVYDVASHAKGLFLASYAGGHLDFFDPRQPVKPRENPRPIVALSEHYQQERPVRWAQGPDGNLYVVTVPVKGRLGGALVRVDPQDLSIKVWRDLIPEQSIVEVLAVPETHELLCATSVQGGSSAIPTQTEACIFLWDVKNEKIAWRGNPVPGMTTYGSLANGDKGVVYGVAGAKFYALDLRSHRVLTVGDLPVRQVHWPGLGQSPVEHGQLSMENRRLIVGLGDDAVWAIDPTNRRASVLARDPSIAGARGFLALPDGTLYYGSGANLMRCRLGR